MSQTVWTKKGPAEMSDRNIILERRVKGECWVVKPALGGSDNIIAYQRAHKYKMDKLFRELDDVLARSLGQ